MTKSNEHKVAVGAFSDEEKAAVYRDIKTRRDIREEFLSDQVPDETLIQLLGAAA